MLQQGYVHVYTGNGKGKTTTMLGLVLRAVGAGLRVYIGQFMKSRALSEITAIENYLPNVKVDLYGGEYVLGSYLAENDAIAAKQGLVRAEQAILSGEYDMVALDEINVAAFMGLIDIQDVLQLIEKKPANVELVLTGRYVIREIVALADLVSDIVDVKHYYNIGVPARVGIEL